MGLFSKKICDICGGEIGFLSGKKIKDGIICKECKSKLSPEFQDYKNSSIQDIKDQLVAREENRKKLDSFKTTYAFGEAGCILIDKENKQFVALNSTSDGLFKGPKEVTLIDQIIDKNPDIIKFSEIENVDIGVTELSREEKQMVDGQQVSYNPKHMIYTESFAIKLTLNHPYVKFIYVPLENGSVQIACDEPKRKASIEENLASSLLNHPELKIENQERAYDHNSFKDMILRNPFEMPDYAFGFKCSLRNKEEIERYRCLLAMSKEIKDILEEKV